MLPLALPLSGSALGLPTAILLVSPSPTSPSLKPFQSCQLIPKDVFSPSGQVDPVRPQHIFCLKDSSMIIKPKVLAEALVLDPGIDVLGTPVSSSVSPHYWDDGGIHCLCSRIL